jgi:hypothetical protein
MTKAAKPVQTHYVRTEELFVHSKCCPILLLAIFYKVLWLMIVACQRCDAAGKPAYVSMTDRIPCFPL